MADLVELYRRNTDLFDARVAAIAADQWSDPTPCSEWDVRTLVNHVVYELLWVPPLTAGQTVDEVGDRFDGDVLGSVPKAAWSEAVGPAFAALEADGALETVVHLSYGDVPVGEYLGQLLTDMAVHGWDLARAIGADDVIDPETAQVLCDFWADQSEMIASSGLFAEPVEVSPDAGPEARLLGLLGRRPS